ncbi:unnamed protein product [Lactuca saligna]|uniref:Uncharacterized protein n=1 Tax=Lactuca saligna TaxID=75948 RepID=A0AA35ZQW2_LACSI|nr:unnamed protein product [Lactuca saligna]
MHESITTLFSSQSNEAERMIHDEEPNDDEIMVPFADLQFYPKEENVPDNLIMLAIHSKSFDYDIQKLRDVAKEYHELIVEQVTKLNESMDLKVVGLKSKLSKEVQKVEQKYTLLHSKVDVIATDITNLVEFKTEYTDKLEVKLEKDSQVFENMEQFLSGFKESNSKVEPSNQSTICQAPISQIILNIESNIKSDLAPILNLVLHLPILLHVQCNYHKG